MSYTHGIRNLRISGILISSPYNGGNRLHLLLYNFRQLLKGEFHNFLPLLLSNQQFSVLRSGCTIPYHCILLITLFGFFEMKWTYVWIIHCKYTTNDLTICQSGQQDLNLRPHGPLTIAQMNLLLHLPSHETKCNKKCNKTKERTFCTCSKINSNTKKLFRQDSFFKFWNYTFKFSVDTCVFKI